jgi:hypothetical protein
MEPVVSKEKDDLSNTSTFGSWEGISHPDGVQTTGLRVAMYHTRFGVSYNP